MNESQRLLAGWASQVRSADALKRMADADEARSKPRFVALIWVSTGNYLLGLKNDGTVWKCAIPGADPLVWTEVSS